METLKPPKGAIRQRKRLGRGRGSGTGTTAGKGTKGQNSRSGGGVRPGFEGGQMPLYRRVARRGFSNYPFKKEYVVVSLTSIESRFSNGDTVNLETLRDQKLIGNRDSLVKILGDGEVSKKLTVVGIRVSRSAAAKIVAAGGSVDNVAGKEIAEASIEAEAEPKAEAKVEPKKAAPKAEAKAEPKKAAPKAEAKVEPKKAAPKAAREGASPAKKQKAAVAKAPAKAPAASKDPAAVEVKDSEPSKASSPKKSAPKKSAPKKAASGETSEADTAVQVSK